jgi:VIT1/CCC1 family predicted Fe2+/Mn2+ transporter
MATYNERSLPEVLQGIVGNIEEIIRSEVQLAKTEVKDELSKASRPAGMMGAGFVLSLYAGGFMLLAAVYGLTYVMAAWMAALIVGVVLAIAATLFISVGKKNLKLVNAVPQRTAETMRENMEWAKKQIR